MLIIQSRIHDSTPSSIFQRYATISVLHVCMLQYPDRQCRQIHACGLLMSETRFILIKALTWKLIEEPLSDVIHNRQPLQMYHLKKQSA